MTNYGWNYPPGVTGYEREIQGPDEEWEEDRECEWCEWQGRVEIQRYRREETWECPRCRRWTTDYDDPGPDEPDERRPRREDDL
jgi:hypothetical protein